MELRPAYGRKAGLGAVPRLIAFGRLPLHGPQADLSLAVSICALCLSFQLEQHGFKDGCIGP